MSSLVRRIQVRIFKKRNNVDKVPCPYGRIEESGLYTDKGEPIMVPVMVWPRLAPKIEEIAA